MSVAMIPPLLDKVYKKRSKEILDLVEVTENSRSRLRNLLGECNSCNSDRLKSNFGKCIKKAEKIVEMRCKIFFPITRNLTKKINAQTRSLKSLRKANRKFECYQTKLSGFFSFLNNAPQPIPDCDADDECSDAPIEKSKTLDWKQSEVNFMSPCQSECD